MKEKILGILKELESDDAIIMCFEPMYIADIISMALKEPDVSERDKEAGWIRGRFPNGNEKQKWLWICFIEDGKRLVDIGFVTHGDFLDADRKLIKNPIAWMVANKPTPPMSEEMNT